MWNKGNPHTLLIGMQTGAATVKKKKRKKENNNNNNKKNSTEVSQKAKNRTTI